MRKQPGKFIVIDGTDGSGKKTQAAMLIKRLGLMPIPFESIEFPQYGSESAVLVEAYLRRGEFGDVNEVPPRVASAFYAVDRWAASGRIRKWLEDGRNVIADRFTGSNMGHQGSKIENEEELKTFLRWIHDLEHVRLGTPEPDLNIILHVPTEITLRLIEERGGAQDIHESNPAHLRAAERTYLTIADMFPDKFRVIECAPGGELLPRATIHGLIWDIVHPLLLVSRQQA